MISSFSQFKHKCSPFHEDLSSFSWGCFFFLCVSSLFSAIHSNSLKTSTVRTPPVKPNKVLTNNSSGENISQSLWLIGNHASNNRKLEPANCRPSRSNNSVSTFVFFPEANQVRINQLRKQLQTNSAYQDNPNK